MKKKIQNTYIGNRGEKKRDPCVQRQRTYLTSGLVVMLRMSCIAQMPTATPVAAKSGYTCGHKPTIRQEDDEQQPGSKRSRPERNGGRNKGRGGGETGR
jgi:hypothetical protein